MTRILALDLPNQEGCNYLETYGKVETQTVQSNICQVTDTGCVYYYTHFCYPLFSTFLEEHYTMPTDKGWEGDGSDSPFYLKIQLI